MSNSIFDLIKGQLALPDLIIDIRKEWGAHTKRYRNEIRAGILHSLKLHEPFKPFHVDENVRGKVMDLERPIQVDGLSVSISHCQEAGGFALNLGPTQIGLDIEVYDRVVRSVAERVSTANEIHEAPSPAHLWAAKEATFKSLLGSHQPAVLPLIRLNSWQRLDPHSWLFSPEIQGVTQSQLSGAVIQFDNLVLGLCKFSP